VVLASRVDGVVLVVKGGSTPRELLRRGIAMLTDAHAAPAGGVLNMVDLQGRHAPYETYGYQYYRRQDDREGRA
jgi:polysaccharide biosynthesis transport protein